jgi:hypothetical protein
LILAWPADESRRAALLLERSAARTTPPLATLHTSAGFSSAYGSPPKFVWLCLGNRTRNDLLALIQRHERKILTFETSPESVLVLS